MNNVKVFVLMAGLTGLVMAIGQLVGGGTGAIFGLLMAAGMNLFMYWGSSSMVLRSYNAQVVNAQQAPELYAMVDRLRQRAGLPMPTVAIAPHDQPNAFATGSAVRKAARGVLPLRVLQPLQAVTRLPGDPSPPRIRGWTWSTLRSSGSCTSPQYTQR